jgi:hypothetical protein
MVKLVSTRAEFITCTLQSDHVKKDEPVRACSTNGGEEECIQRFGGERIREETTEKI